MIKPVLKNQSGSFQLLGLLLLLAVIPLTMFGFKITKDIRSHAQQTAQPPQCGGKCKMLSTIFRGFIYWLPDPNDPTNTSKGQHFNLDGTPTRAPYLCRAGCADGWPQISASDLQAGDNFCDHFGYCGVVISVERSGGRTSVRYRITKAPDGATSDSKIGEETIADYVEPVNVYRQPNVSAQNQTGSENGQSPFRMCGDAPCFDNATCNAPGNGDLCNDFCDNPEVDCAANGIVPPPRSVAQDGIVGGSSQGSDHTAGAGIIIVEGCDKKGCTVRENGVVRSLADGERTDSGAVHVVCLPNSSLGCRALGTNGQVIPVAGGGGTGNQGPSSYIPQLGDTICNLQGQCGPVIGQGGPIDNPDFYVISTNQGDVTIRREDVRVRPKDLFSDTPQANIGNCTVGVTCTDASGFQGVLRQRPDGSYELQGATGTKPLEGTGQKVLNPPAGQYMCDDARNCGYTTGRRDEVGNIQLCSRPLVGGACTGTQVSVPTASNATPSGPPANAGTMIGPDRFYEQDGHYYVNNQEVSPDYYTAARNYNTCHNANGCPSLPPGVQQRSDGATIVRGHESPSGCTTIQCMIDHGELGEFPRPEPVGFPQPMPDPVYRYDPGSFLR